MKQRVLIIGGYGNFGRFITKKLVLEEHLHIIIAGRSLQKAEGFIQEFETQDKLEAVFLDIYQADMYERLVRIKPDIVIHTSGPFQNQNYNVAKACMACGSHYIDLADARDFVANIGTLDKQAQEHNVLLVSGASSVPCFTAALIDYYQELFSSMEEVCYTISTAQRTGRGIATIAAILSYIGKPFTTLIQGRKQTIYGWQGLWAKKHEVLGWQLFGYCDIPDLALFPKRYPQLKTIRFYAGLELPIVHVTLWLLSWFARLTKLNLQPLAPYLFKISRLFDAWGTKNSAFCMKLSGLDHNQATKTIAFELIARSGDGPYIPCIPAILITKKLAAKNLTMRGAYPCMGIITLNEYLDGLKDLAICWKETTIC